MADLPQFGSTAYASAVNTTKCFDWGDTAGTTLKELYIDGSLPLGNEISSDRQIVRSRVFAPSLQKSNVKELENTMSTSTRLIKIFIVDPDENLKVENRLLHKSEEILTDLTDQELFYEIPIKEILAKHNEIRGTTVDKKTKEREKVSMLEPIRISQLKMQVIVLAQF